MLRHEVVPPPDVWNKISDRLDKEYNFNDASLCSKLENAAVTPPAGIWDNIAIELYEQPGINIPAKVIPLIYKRIAIAAMLAAVVAVSVMYLFTGNPNSAGFIDKTVAKNDPVIKYKPVTTDNDQHVLSPASVIGQKPQPRLLPVQIAYARNIAAASNVHDPGNSADVPITVDVSADAAELSNVQCALQTVSALNHVNVEAPLLRDANGHIIMDMKLITDRGNHFITVTGPNGAQTKISSKFLPCLSYLNGDEQVPGKIDAEGIECSEKFAEWRDKLLSQPEYVPAANNFFDIFELQNLIQD
ncbi:MAG: hypothetical protein ABI415_09715 [Flavitalea sp.]